MDEELVVPAEPVGRSAKLLLAVVGFSSLVAVVLDCIILGMVDVPLTLMVPSTFGHILSAACAYVAAMPRGVNRRYRRIARVFTVVATMFFVAACVGVARSLVVAFT